MYHCHQSHLCAKALSIQFQSINHLPNVKPFSNKSFFIFPPTVPYKLSRSLSKIKFDDFRVMPTPINEAAGSLKASFLTGTKIKQSTKAVLRFLSLQKHSAQRLLLNEGLHLQNQRDAEC
jgi:hypothetical protein